MIDRTSGRPTLRAQGPLRAPARLGRRSAAQPRVSEGGRLTLIGGGTLPPRTRPEEWPLWAGTGGRTSSFVGVRRSSATAWAALSSVAIRDFWRQMALLLVVLGFVNASNYLFHVVISRLLGPSDYGALAALLAVVLVFSIPFGVIQTAVADKTATLALGRAERGRPTARGQRTQDDVAVRVRDGNRPRARRLSASEPLSPRRSPLDAAPGPVRRRISTRERGTRRPSGRTALSRARRRPGCRGPLRLVLGIAFVWAGLGVSGALLATVASAALTVPIAFRLLHIGRRAWGSAKRSLASVRGDIAPALFGLTSFWLLAEADIALARHYLDADTSGFYSSAGLIARALLFLPAAVGLVAFPAS